MIKDDVKMKIYGIRKINEKNYAFSGQIVFELKAKKFGKYKLDEMDKYDVYKVKDEKDKLVQYPFEIQFGEIKNDIITNN